MEPSKLILAHFHQKLSTTYEPVTYPRLWRALLEGKIPAERKGGRWMVSESALPIAAEVFGLSQKRSTAA
jgi:hypothetical protein